MTKVPVAASMEAIDIKPVSETRAPRAETTQGPPARAGRVALTLRIEPELHRELRAAAFQADTTIQDLILQALEKDGYKVTRSDRR